VRVEARLFAGMAAFFLVAGGVYAAFATTDPAGISALAVAFVMSSLIAFFLSTQARRRGTRPEDRRDGEIGDRAGPVALFPASSPYPPVMALGFALTATGVVFGPWLMLLGGGLFAGALFGFAFQYADEPD
jgi:Cytochrome c oxidase subunit IV